jgi:hypothetical protein
MKAVKEQGKKQETGAGLRTSVTKKELRPRAGLRKFATKKEVAHELQCYGATSRRDSQ